MRRSFVMLVPIALSGCISFGSNDAGKLPPDARGGVYTFEPAVTVAACIVKAVGAGETIEGEDHRIMSPLGDGVAYVVGPNRSRKTYPTQLAVIGDRLHAAEEQRATLCAIR